MPGTDLPDRIALVTGAATLSSAGRATGCGSTTVSCGCGPNADTRTFKAAPGASSRSVFATASIPPIETRIEE